MKSTLTLICLASAMCLTSALSAQEYFGEGTKWTELRLNTQEHDKWFTEVTEDGQTKYVPNYERVDYYVQGDTVVNHGYDGMKFRYVWQHREGLADAVRFVITQDRENNSNMLCVTDAYEEEYDGASHLGFQYPARLYDFDWRTGKEMTFEDMYGAACTCTPTNSYSFGSIQEIKSAVFGTEHAVEYVDVDSMTTYTAGFFMNRQQVGAKLIKGIGVTSWESAHCLFGPARPDNDLLPNGEWDKAPYHSILVHFEQNGEVLYDLWPTSNGELAQGVQGVQFGTKKDEQAVYDLKGCRIEGKPSRGIYIIGGKKRVVN